MSKFNFRRINWKNILIISLALVLGVGAIAGVSSIVKNEKTTLSSLEFKRGALNDLGFYIESDQSIYTKDLIECQGLEIEPDFETLGEYQVYYYDSNKQFIGKTDKINSQTDGVYVKGDTYVIAKYCRIVITPEVPKDEDGHVIEDYAIKFYEVAGIAAKYKISIDKEQKYSLEKIIANSNNIANVLGEGRYDHADKTFINMTDYGIYIFEPVDARNYNYCLLKVSSSTLSAIVTIDGEPYTCFGVNDVATGLPVSDTYSVLESDKDFAYVLFDISACDAIYGSVDIDSVDVLEVYFLN